MRRTKYQDLNRYNVFLRLKCPFQQFRVLVFSHVIAYLLYNAEIYIKNACQPRRIHIHYTDLILYVHVILRIIAFLAFLACS